MNRDTLINTLKKTTPLFAAAFAGALTTIIVLHRDEILQAIRKRMKTR